MAAFFKGLYWLLWTLVGLLPGLFQLAFPLALVAGAFYAWYLLFGFVLLSRPWRGWPRIMFQLLRGLLKPYLVQIYRVSIFLGVLLTEVVELLANRLSGVPFPLLAFLGFWISVVTLTVLQSFAPSCYGAKIELTSDELIWDARLLTCKALLGFSSPQPYAVDVFFPLHVFGQLVASQAGGLLLLIIFFIQVRAACQKIRKHLAASVPSKEKIKKIIFNAGVTLYCLFLPIGLQSLYLWWTEGELAVLKYWVIGLGHILPDLRLFFEFLGLFFWVALKMLWGCAKSAWPYVWKIVYILLSGWFF